MSRVQIERLMDEVIKELLAEYKAEEEKKAQEKEQEQEFLTFDMALNYLLSEHRKGNFTARIRRYCMPEGEYVFTLPAEGRFEANLAYKGIEGRIRPYTPGHNSIFATDWQIIK